MERNASRWRKLLILGLAVLVVVVAVIPFLLPDQKEEWLPSKKELSTYELYIANFGTGDEMRTVPDEAFRKEVISLCMEAEPYRRFLDIFDLVLGESTPDVYFIFEKDSTQYIISFIDPDEQLSLDNIHREQPVLLVRKCTVGVAPQGYKVRDTEWVWYCTMPVLEYTELLHMGLSYWDGEPIKK